MKLDATKFIDNLILQDYILFGSVFTLFVLFIILAIVLRKKLGLAIFFILLSICILFLGPTVGYIQMHKYLFKNKTIITHQKKLEFTKAVVIYGNITNESKFNFQECKIKASAYKVTKNEYRNYLLKFKPFKKMSIVEENIVKGETREFKMIMEPFTYSKDYNISIQGSCK
jgi:hypothetical protein